jgi:hypothetical protein
MVIDFEMRNCGLYEAVEKGRWRCGRSEELGRVLRALIVTTRRWVQRLYSN